MIENNQFLKATPLYKEYLILDLLSNNPNASQRVIASHINSSLSMVNQYIDEYITSGYIKKEEVSKSKYSYILTKEGTSRLAYLSVSFISSVRSTYLIAKEYIVSFLNEIINKGYKDILLYGAGSVAEITLQVLQESELNLNIKALIDDDALKHNTKVLGYNVISKEQISNYEVDAILISTYIHNETIRKQLKELSYQEDKIINYF